MPNQNSDCIRYYDYDGNGEQSLPENAVINLLNDKKKSFFEIIFFLTFFCSQKSVPLCTNYDKEGFCQAVIEWKENHRYVVLNKT